MPVLPGVAGLVVVCVPGVVAVVPPGAVPGVVVVPVCAAATPKAKNSAEAARK